MQSLLRLWHRARRSVAGRRRMYSANRLLALHEYCESASRTRVLFVLLLFCTPPLLIMIILDAIPLQDPSDGWRANVSCWFRVVVDNTLICAAILVHAQAVIPEIAFTRTQNAGILIGVTLGGTASMLLLAELWMFPIPFTYAVGAVPFILILNTLVVLTLGTRNRERLWKFAQFSNIINTHAAMIIVYPTYNAIFLSLDGTAQLAFVLVLPAIKIFFRRITGIVYPVDDDQFTAMLSSVDIFDALYMTKCMQSGGTLAVGFAIIAVDMLQNFVSFRRLEQQTRFLTTATVSNQLLDIQITARAGLLAWAVRMLASEEHFGSLTFQSNTRYTLSAPSQQLLGIMQARNSLASLPKQVALIEAARLLHASESIVVVEYVETVVPIFYAICVATLFHLPNAKYYSDMQALETADQLHGVLKSILVYAFMELLSLLYVHRRLQRQFGISVFYQLAFALESEWKMFLSEFTAWILLIFQFLLVHSGADFTFKFDWQRANHAGS